TNSASTSAAAAMTAGAGSPSFGPFSVLRLTTTRGFEPGRRSQSGTGPPPENGTGRIGAAPGNGPPRRLAGVHEMVSSGLGMSILAITELVRTARNNSVAGHKVFSCSTDGIDS